MLFYEICGNWGAENKDGPRSCKLDIHKQFFVIMALLTFTLHNRGNEFCNMVSKELYKKCGVRHHIMMPYHPQVNGMIERCNHTTSEMILKMISTERLGELPDTVHGRLVILLW